MFKTIVLLCKCWREPSQNWSETWTSFGSLINALRAIWHARINSVGLRFVIADLVLFIITFNKFYCGICFWISLVKFPPFFLLFAHQLLAIEHSKKTSQKTCIRWSFLTEYLLIPKNIIMQIAQQDLSFFLWFVGIHVI